MNKTLNRTVVRCIIMHTIEELRLLKQKQIGNTGVFKL